MCHVRCFSSLQISIDLPLRSIKNCIGHELTRNHRTLEIMCGTVTCDGCCINSLKKKLLASLQYTTTLLYPFDRKLLLPPEHELLERGMDFIQLLRTWGQKNQETNNVVI